MRVHVVSDVHGRADALPAAAEGADAFICLGDLVLFIDYQDHSRGIMGDLFGADAVRKMIELRTEQRFDEAREWSRGLWAQLEGDRVTIMESAIRRQYAQLFAAFPTPTYLTYGNVDLPHLYPDYLRDGLTLLDGQTVDIGGLRFGFVGGGLRTPMNTPYEIDDETYAAKVAAIGEVDVLCCHIPPHVPELVYDVKANRFERGSEAVLAAIQATQPKYALFGHVHQPLVDSLYIGSTRCVNVGHFNAHGTPFVLEW
ncbi:metallophosphoesterase family protein [Frankia sp. CNm7]|uniref:Metallophosphoesterase family protein n=1 Tax=Frankia nepalensis TaxID=1836974 RepID=A0A937RGC2_9ACTN|nr:metallophosphoesterase [Frankia nepalensis]MBL7502306.1 metallophosphoesterase family protein [Frankia nepalensis]MBL7514191.1 metallophosphoesterase family protein [Frankia nepalensis]MBL7522062.1 metallophosphoesterase family protein [Frankia nepalensis]MBL7631668.1 metallophosphoesterase family protein [Frankia nepalensis]